MTLEKRLAKLEKVIAPELPPVYPVCGSGGSCYWIGTSRYDTLADVAKAYPGRRVIATKVRMSDELLAELQP